MRAKERAQTPCFSDVFTLDSHSNLSRSSGAHHIFYKIFDLGTSMLTEHGDPLILSKLKALIVASTNANHGSSSTPISYP